MKTTYLITVTAPNGEEILSLRSFSLAVSHAEYISLERQIEEGDRYPKGTKITFNDVQTIESFSYTK